MDHHADTPNPFTKAALKQELPRASATPPVPNRPIHTTHDARLSPTTARRLLVAAVQKSSLPRAGNLRAHVRRSVRTPPYSVRKPPCSPLALLEPNAIPSYRSASTAASPGGRSTPNRRPLSDAPAIAGAFYSSTGRGSLCSRECACKLGFLRLRRNGSRPGKPGGVAPLFRRSWPQTLLRAYNIASATGGDVADVKR